MKAHCYATFVIAIAILIPSKGFSQESDPKTKSQTITVTGEALLMVEPDQAELDIGVVTQSKTAVGAGTENAEKLARVMTEVKKLLGSDSELKTAGYSVIPNYRYPKEGGTPEIVGYTATNDDQVRTAALGTVGRMIDAAMRSGANRVQRLVFTLKDQQAAQQKTLRSATIRAKAKAEEIAAALGVKIVRVLSVTESGQGFRPLMAETLAMRADAPMQTSVEAGTIEIRSTVTLTAEIPPK
jgi:uncharacterized protein YggE